MDLIGSKESGGKSSKLSPPVSEQQKEIGAQITSESEPPFGNEVSLLNEFKVDWSASSVAELEEIVLGHLDVIFKCAIKKIVYSGYTVEDATKVILRHGSYLGGDDIMSNIVDNALEFLRTGQEINLSREQNFESLQLLAKHVLIELIHSTKENKPSLSTGEALWCLLLCDMNVSDARVIANGSDYEGIASSGSSSISSHPHMKAEAKSVELSIPNTRESVAPTSSPITVSDATGVAGSSSMKKPQEEGTSSVLKKLDRPVGISITSKSPNLEEKGNRSTNVQSGKDKGEELRHRLAQMQASRSKGSSRTGRLNSFRGLCLDKRAANAALASTARNLKAASKQISTGRAKTNVSSSSSTSNWPPALFPSTISTDNIGLLPFSPPTTTDPATASCNCNTDMSRYIFNGMPYSKPVRQRIPQSTKDDYILKLINKVDYMQNHLDNWTDWANQKGMQATQRLSKSEREAEDTSPWPEPEAVNMHREMLEELITERLRLVQLSRALSQAEVSTGKAESKRKQEEKAKEELPAVWSSPSKERELDEACLELKKDKMKSKADKNMQMYKERSDQMLETEISLLTNKMRSLKIAHVRPVMDDNAIFHKESHNSSASVGAEPQECPEKNDVNPDQELQCDSTPIPSAGFNKELERKMDASTLKPALWKVYTRRKAKGKVQG